MKDEPIYRIIMLAPKEAAWYARVVVYKSPTGLVDHMTECLNVLEVGRRQDLRWAIRETIKQWPQAIMGAPEQ